MSWGTERGYFDDDEPEYMDLLAMEVNEDVDGNIVDGYGNLIYPDDELYDSREDQEYAENALALLLTKTVQDKMRELGKSEADYLAASKVSMVLKDGEGNPSHNLTVRLRHPQREAGYDFDGSYGFYLAPVGVGKDQWGRDLKSVSGHFSWDYINDRQDDGYSMTYAGCDPQEYVKSVLTEETLASAELMSY